MRKPLGAAVLLACFAVFLSHAPLAHAGENCIGIIVVSDAGTVSNATTGYGSAGCAITPTDRCACAQAFAIGAAQKITVQSDTAYIVGADFPVDAGNGMAVAAGVAWPTSTANSRQRTALPDGGSYLGGLIWCTPPVGSASVTCRVQQRNGNE